MIKVGTYFGDRVGSIGSDTVLVHEDYIETAADDTDDGAKTITADTGSTATLGESESGGGGGLDHSGTDGAAQVFACPQCGDTLQGTSCSCGFDFDASDVEEGSINVEGGDITDLLETFDELQNEVDEKEITGPTTTRVPSMDKLRAVGKPTLIDKLDKKLRGDWDIHTVNVNYEGTLSAAGVAQRGLDVSSLDGQVTVNETLTISTTDPISQSTLLNEVLLGLDVPEDAEFEVWLEVEKGD